MTRRQTNPGYGIRVFLGPGSDGVATLDGTATVGWATKSGSTYTMSRDTYVSSLTVNSGVTLGTNGFRIFCTGTVTNNGTIENWGGNSGPGGGGGTLQGGGAGASGSTTVGTAGSGISNSLGGSGGSGGAGASGAGGAGNTANAPNYGAGSTQQLSNLPTAVQGYSLNVSTEVPLRPGQGGGGGGGDGTNSGTSGAGGGGFIMITALSFINAGSVNAVGGAANTPTAGNCGGGGGGGGGIIVINCANYAVIGTGVVHAQGGAAGSGSGTGSAGTAGAAGTVQVNVFPY